MSVIMLVCQRCEKSKIATFFPPAERRGTKHTCMACAKVYREERKGTKARQPNGCGWRSNPLVLRGSTFHGGQRAVD
jgi:hypothetical protein